jgi:GNAT superfamily N-acetyltransferase
LSKYEREGYLIEPLAKDHDSKTFSCGNQILDRYLRVQASQDVRKRVATVFILICPPQNIVVGFYTLSSGSVDLGEWPEALTKKLPRYPFVPVTLLGRLALDQNHQGKGLGEYLLMDSLWRSLVAAEQVASLAVIVDAIDDNAKTFYHHYGFILFPKQTRRMFLPMQTIRELF